MSSFRIYGGLNFSANNNITKSYISNSEQMNINNYSGQPNSQEVYASHIDMSGNSILHTGTIYFQDGTSISSATGDTGDSYWEPTGLTGIQYGALSINNSNTGSIYTQNIQAKNIETNVNLYTNLTTGGSLTIGSTGTTCNISSSATFYNSAPVCGVTAINGNQLVNKSYVDSKTYQVLNFSPTEVTHIKKSIIYRYGNTITSTSITAKLDNAPTIPQVYTFGKQIANLWLTCSTGLNQLYYSTNGTSWGATTNNPFSSSTNSGVVNGLAWNGSRWVAVGKGTVGTNVYAQINYSDDGFSWNQQSPALSKYGPFGSGGTGYGVAWNGINMWVAVGGPSPSTYTGPTTIAWSTNNGLSWSSSTSPDAFGSGGTGYGVAYNGTMWVAVGKGSQTIAYSTNGKNWTGTGTGIFNQAHGVAWNGIMWVAVGDGNNEVGYSFNGTIWTGIGNKFSGVGYGVAWNGKLWVAVGTGTHSIIYSYNGLDWTPANSPMFSDSTYYAKGISWSGSMWFAVGLTSGTNSNIAYSIDGINWASATGVSTTADIVTSVAFNSARPNTITFNNSASGVITIPSNITLNSGDQLDVVCDSYYNAGGFTNCSISIDN